MSYIAKGHPQQTKNIYPVGSMLPGLENTWTPPDLEIDNRATDPAYFDSLNRRFGGFTVDVAADERNRKAERYFDVRADGLTQPWAGERVWCNPPFSNLRPWVAKAWAEWGSEKPPELIVMLLPANRTEQKWWQELVERRRDRQGSPLRTEFIPGRLRFVAGDQIRSNERPPFGCCLLIWQDDAQLRLSGSERNDERSKG